MSSYKHTGTVTFVHHDKRFVSLEYPALGKMKSINGSMTSLKASKTHSFRMGDVFGFNIKPTPRGDKLMAVDLVFLYNNALLSLIQKAHIKNKFSGYLKKTESGFFIKDPESYMMLPLLLSPWELVPKAEWENEPIEYVLNNLEKPEKLFASLHKPRFIQAYRKAEEFYKKQQPLSGMVTKVTPFGIHVNLFGGEISGKISFSKDKIATQKSGLIKPGDALEILISFLNPYKIVLQSA